MFNTQLLLARRTHPGLLKRIKVVKEPKSQASFDFATQKTLEEGLTRYELDFTETSQWTVDMLNKLESKKQDLKAINKPLEKTKNPICVTYTDYYCHDFSKPKNPSETLFSVKVSNLGLDPAHKHVFLLLAGNKYDPYTDRLDLKVEIDSLEDKVDRYKRLVMAHEQLTKLIEESKKNKELVELELDLSHVKKKQREYPFPKQWMSTNSQ